MPGRRQAGPAELREECRLFVEHLHPTDAWGVVTLFSRSDQKQRLHRPAALAAAVPTLVGREDLYVSVNRFRGRRGDGRLLVLNALFVDLDYYHSKDPAIAGATPHEALTVALELLSRANFPTPTTAVFTGRGLALYWRHSHLPAKAASRWRACLKELRTLLAPLCPDPAVSDPSRVMRLPGTINSRSGEYARLLLTPGEGYEFEALSSALLPQRRHVIRRRKAQADVENVRAPRAARSSRRSVLNQHTLRRKKFEDLERLLRHRYPEGVLPAGHRDHWMFAVSTLLAFMVPFDRLAGVLVQLAARVALWSEEETLARMQATLKRASRAAAGQKDRRGDREVDPRYNPSRAWFIDLLGITEEEMRDADLRILVSPKVARERAAARQAGLRRRKGAVDRQTYERRAGERRLRAAALHEAGTSYREIARVLDTTPEGARKLVSRAGGGPVVSPPDNSVTGNGGPLALPGGSGGGAPRPFGRKDRERPPSRGPRGLGAVGNPTGFPSERSERQRPCRRPARERPSEGGPGGTDASAGRREALRDDRDRSDRSSGDGPCARPSPLRGS